MTPRLAAIALPALLLLTPGLAAAQSYTTPGGPPANIPPQPQPAPFQTTPRYQAGMQYQNPGAGGAGRGITKQEFLARAAQMAAQRFDQMDANHDGVVTAQERMAFWQSRRANGGGTVTVHGGRPAGSEAEPGPLGQ